MSEWFIVAASALVAVPLLAIPYSEWKRKSDESAEEVTLNQAIKNHIPKVYPPLTKLPHHPCGHGRIPGLQLSLSDALFCDPAALSVWDVLLNGQQVHTYMLSPLNETFGGEIRTVADVERIARKRPNSEWLIRFIEPLQSSVYQRHGDDQWNLVRVGNGMF